MKYLLILLVLYILFMLNQTLGIIVTTGGFIYILYKNFPSFYARKGNACFNEKKYDEALKWYEKAYNTGRASVAITMTYAIILFRLSKVDEAEKIFNFIILSNDKKTTPDMKNRAKQYRALLYFKTGRVEDAMEEATEVFKNYKSTVSYGLICYLKHAVCDPIDEFFDLCVEAYEYNSDDRDIIDNLVLAYLKKGELQKAKELCDKLLENHPQFTEAYYHGALVYSELGDTDKAKELLKKIENNCQRTFLTTVSVEEIKELKNKLEG